MRTPDAATPRLEQPNIGSRFELAPAAERLATPFIAFDPAQTQSHPLTPHARRIDNAARAIDNKRALDELEPTTLQDSAAINTVLHFVLPGELRRQIAALHTSGDYWTRLQKLRPLQSVHITLIAPHNQGLATILEHLGARVSSVTEIPQAPWFAVAGGEPADIVLSSGVFGISTRKPYDAFSGQQQPEAERNLQLADLYKKILKPGGIALSVGLYNQQPQLDPVQLMGSDSYVSPPTHLPTTHISYSLARTL